MTKGMTVADLVLELTKMPYDARVTTEQVACGETHFVPVLEHEVRLSDDKKMVILGKGIN